VLRRTKAHGEHLPRYKSQQFPPTITKITKKEIVYADFSLPNPRNEISKPYFTMQNSSKSQESKPLGGAHHSSSIHQEKFTKRHFTREKDHNHQE
jgi:hypothetical protein